MRDSNDRSSWIISLISARIRAGLAFLTLRPTSPDGEGEPAVEAATDNVEEERHKPKPSKTAEAKRSIGERTNERTNERRERKRERERERRLGEKGNKKERKKERKNEVKK